MLNKKVFCFLGVGILFFGAVIAIGVAIITSGDIEAIKGAVNIPYPIYLNNNESIAGFQLEVAHTPYISYVGLGLSQRMSLLNNSVIIINDETPGVLKIAALIEEQIPMGDEKIFDIIFDVDEGAIPNNYTMSLTQIVAANINSTSLFVETTDGIFEIVDPYDFVFLPPISNFENFILQDGATLPLKFDVTKGDNFISDGSVLVRIYNSSLGIDKTYNASGIGGDYIRIDADEKIYIVNINTNEENMPLGLYNIDVSFSNFQLEVIDFELIQNGEGKGRQR